MPGQNQIVVIFQQVPRLTCVIGDNQFIGWCMRAIGRLRMSDCTHPAFNEIDRIVECSLFFV